jgi:hypothetical protein
MGLPVELYTAVVKLLQYVTGDVLDCTTTTDGLCVFPSSCSEYSKYGDYYFKFNFTGANDENYIRVPLRAFASDSKNSDGSMVCQIMLTNLMSDN